MTVVTFGEGLGVLRTQLGSLTLANSLDISTGGAEGNVAIGLARLGLPARWIGRVGDDGLGRRVARELRAEGVEVHAIEDAAHSTGIILKESGPEGRTAVTYYRRDSAGSRLSPADIDRHLTLEPDDLLHITGITAALSSSAHDAVFHALDLAESIGARVSFDVNHRSGLWSHAEAKPVYREIAKRADIVFASVDEAALLVDEPADDLSELAGAVASLGPKEVVITRGAGGALALATGTIHHRAAVPILAVDTVGAGDAFVAGYLAERIVGLNIDERLATATKMGALACLHAGDWEGLPTRQELNSFRSGADPVER